MTSKEMVRRAFSRGELPRNPFIPWVFSHAARLEQISVREMLADPGRLARALHNAQSLYGYDAVTNVFDHTLEAECCGCPVVWGAEHELPSVLGHPLSSDVTQSDILNLERNGRLPVVLEATRRLKITLGRTVAMVAVITGPFALADRLLAVSIMEGLEDSFEKAKSLVKFAGQVALKVCQMYCELEPDVVVIADDSLPQLAPEHFSLARSVFGPIWNTVRFYNAHPVLMLRGCSTDKLDHLLDLGADSTVVSGEIDFTYLNKAVSKRDLVFGYAIPCSALADPQQELDDYVSKYFATARSRMFLTTEWEVPADTPPENMHELIKLITKG